jgi:hypothetical protein
MIRKSSRGWALITAVLILTIVAIIVPALIRLIQKDTKDSVVSGKKTIALQLAEAGQDRGAWKLRESDNMWNTAASGVAIAGYNDDVVYSDVDGGQYKISISTSTELGKVQIISKGRSTGETDIRAIKAIYSRGAVLGAMSVNGALQYRPNLNVHWGPVVTFTSITQDPDEHYPRKYSAGQIVGRDVVNDSDNGAMPSGNWAISDYAAFYDLGAVPVVDLDYYKTKAKASIVEPVLKRGSGSGDAAPYTGDGYNSGYYPGTTNSGGVKVEKGTGSGNLSFACSTCVVYIEGEVKRYPSGTWLDVEALVVTGDMDFNGGGNSYTTTIPNLASEEYQYVSEGTQKWTDEGWTDGGSETVTDCGFHGFLYVGGNVTNAGGGSTLVGAIFVNGTITTNTTTVYYDSAVTNNVRLSNAVINRDSWDEIRTSW